MKVKTTCPLILLLSTFLICSLPSGSRAEETSQCVACHTSAKKLIDITREIEKAAPAVQVTITAGEG